MNQVMSKSEPVARREHRCDWCFTTVAPGERYHVQNVLGDDGFYTWKACAPCMSIANKVQAWMWDDYEGISDDDFLEWAREQDNDPDALAYLERRNAR